MSSQQERSRSSWCSRAAWQVPQSNRTNVQRPSLGAALELLPCRSDRLAVNRIGLPGGNDRFGSYDPGLGRAAGALGKGSATIETAESLPQAVHRSGLGDERVKAEVRTNLDGLGCDHDGQLVTTPVTVGIDNRANPIQGIDPIERAHASSDQMRRIASVLECGMGLAGGAHPIHDDSNAAYLRAILANGIVDRLDEPERGSRHRFPVAYWHQLRSFGGLHAATQLHAAVQIRLRIQGETLRLLIARRSRHFDGDETSRQRSGVPLRDLGEGLRERHAQVHFIQDHEAVVTGEAGMDRPHARRDSVAPEQEARAELVHRGDHNPWLIRPGCPVVIDGNPAAQRGDAQELPIAQSSQAIPDLVQNGCISRFYLISNSPCSLANLLDDDPPIDDEHHTPGRNRRSCSHYEHCGVEHGGLAGTGRQIDDFRPCSPVEHLLRQSPLPWKGLVAVDILEECSEVAEVQLVRHGRFDFPHRIRIEATHRSHPRWPPIE